MSGPVVLYAEFTARPERLDEVEQLVTRLADDVRQEPGNQEFTVYQRVEEPCRFFVFERYVDRAAFEAHLAAPYGTAFNAALGGLIAESGSQLTFLSTTAGATPV
jgi:quinol monooxygenase YgiN